MNLRRKCYSQGRDGRTTPNGTDRATVNNNKKKNADVSCAVAARGAA